MSAGTKRLPWRFACCACAALAAAPAWALVAADLPAEQRQGTVSYRSGGIGEDEARAMQEAARQYPLELQFVAREGNGRGAWLADVDVAIRDGGGNTVLQTRATGPILLARLPAGRYVVTATPPDGGAQQTRRIEVPARGAPRQVLFGW